MSVLRNPFIPSQQSHTRRYIRRCSLIREVVYSVIRRVYLQAVSLVLKHCLGCDDMNAAHKVNKREDEELDELRRRLYLLERERYIAEDTKVAQEFERHYRLIKRPYPHYSIWFFSIFIGIIFGGLWSYILAMAEIVPTYPPLWLQGLLYFCSIASLVILLYAVFDYLEWLDRKNFERYFHLQAFILRIEPNMQDNPPAHDDSYIQ